MSVPRNPDTHTFTVNGAQVTLTRRTNRHALYIDRALLALEAEGDDAADRGYKRLFAKMVAQTASLEGELGLTLPSPLASPAELRAAYEVFMDADGAIGDAFYAALDQVNIPLGPREFLPADALPEDERKNLPGAAEPGGQSGAPSSGGLSVKRATSQD